MKTTPRNKPIGTPAGDIHVVLGFDMETDIGSFSAGYTGVQQGTPRLLDLLERQGVAATFYFTGACARANPKILTAVRKGGHEIGCHSVFHETVGDALFDIPGLTPLLPEEVPHRLAVATDWVAEVSGERPVSFRAPRLFGSTAMINALEELGYLTDASYPMYYYRERLSPYHPSREAWTQEGNLRILELPNFADLSMDSKDPYGRDRDQWPLFRTSGAEALLRHVDGFCGYCRTRNTAPFLCFYLHPWEFHEMPQGDLRFGEGTIRPDAFIVKNCGDYALQQLDALITQLKRRGARFLTARAVAIDL